jgi:hypothetical protein
MSLIRGVLLAGQFRSQHDLNKMSRDDMRNTLIVELAGRSRQTNLQSFNDDTLAGMGALLVYLRTARIRNDAELKTMTADDMRNILIVELGTQTQMTGPALQGMGNIDLVLLGLGKPLPGSLNMGDFIRGVLVTGQFRTQHELNNMSPDDQRNTLIVEMTKHSNQTDYQAFGDSALAGAGAVMVFLRMARIRSDAELKRMSADDQRNVAIVEVGSQTNLGSRLQGLTNLDLVLTALGVDPVFKTSKPRSYVFSVDSFECRTQRSDNEHSDSDWATLVVTVIDPVTKNARVLPTEPIHLEGAIKAGNLIKGPFQTVPFELDDGATVVVNCLITNLGSSDAEDQFKQGVEVTKKVVDTVAPIAGTVIGFVFGDPQAGFSIGKEIAGGFEIAISGFGEAFDFMGIHAGPANCNGEVLSDTFIYQPGEWVQSINRPASKSYTGPQGNERCGSPPESTLNFSAQRFPPGGIFGNDG